MEHRNRKHTDALDEVLRLLADPQALYDTLPEGLKPLLVQPVFEKLWILDTAVVGCELSEPFAELLTVEAQLALQLALIEQEREREATYYRRRETIMSLSHLSGSWGRPFIEHLHGMLAIDTKRTPYPALALSA